MRTMFSHDRRDIVVLTSLCLAASACASTGATFRSGVGDSFPDHPPYYAGASMQAVASEGFAYQPIVFQRGASQSEIFDPKANPGSPVAQLLAEMNAFVDSLMSSSVAKPARITGTWATPPNVIFGCATETGAPDGDCAEQGSNTATGMRLAVGRASKEWIDSARAAMTSRNVSRLVVLTLEVGQYLPQQRGILGRKEVELGSGHTVQLPWLTSTDTPVSVLQVTGTVIGPDGLSLRIGAEGFLAKRTPLLVSAIGAQETLSDADVESVRTRRREDLPGQPLAWRVAVSELLSRLTGREFGR